jgi:hypothetical protein
LEVPADISQQAKSAAADGLTYSDSIDKKVRYRFFVAKIIDKSR